MNFDHLLQLCSVFYDNSTFCVCIVPLKYPRYVFIFVSFMIFVNQYNESSLVGSTHTKNALPF